MSKVRILGYAVAMMALAMFSACGKAEPDKTPEEVVREGIINSFDVAKSSFEMNISVDGEGPDVADPSKTVPMSFEIMMSGSADQTDMTKPLANLVIDGSFKNGEAAAEEFAGELRIKESMVYAMVSKFPSLGGQVPAEMVEPNLNKWWKYEVPAGTLDAFKSLSVTEEDTEQITKMKEFFKTNNLIKDLKYEGTEKVMGESSYKYSGTLDEEVFKALVKLVGEVAGEAVPADAMNFDEVEDIMLTVWVGVEDMTMRGMKADVTAAPADGSKATIAFEVMMGDLGKEVTVEEPADAADIMTLLGPLMGGMMGAPMDDSMMTDPAMMGDDSMMLDAEGMNAAGEAVVTP